MNYQETVKYLKSYRDLYFRLEYINNKIKGIKGISYEEDNIGPHKSLNDYLDEKYMIMEKMTEIENMIGNIKGYKQQQVLKYKFLEFMTLEMCSEHMGYSLSQVKRYYREGIKGLIEIE